MGSRHQTVELLRQGLSITQIAKQRERAVSTVVQHIRLQLGEGQLSPAEVILSCPPERRAQLDQLHLKHQNHTYRTFEKHAQAQGFSREEAQLYFDVRRSAAFRGDIYVMISDIELALHNLVSESLMDEFGPNEEQWWRLGVPATVRKSCVQAREDDPNPVADPFCYTTFIHLSEIINSNWRVFQLIFPDKIVGSKKSLLSRLGKLNQLRNAVMHPVKRKAWSEGELQALKEMHDLIAVVSGKVVKATTTSEISL